MNQSLAIAASLLEKAGRVRGHYRKTKSGKASFVKEHARKVIGHTRSGKPIYDKYSKRAYRGFTYEDHADAVHHLEKLPGIDDLSLETNPIYQHFEETHEMKPKVLESIGPKLELLGFHFVDGGSEHQEMDSTFGSMDVWEAWERGNLGEGTVLVHWYRDRKPSYEYYDRRSRKSFDNEAGLLRFLYDER